MKRAIVWVFVLFAKEFEIILKVMFAEDMVTMSEIFGVGIVYDKDIKEHTSKIEMLRQAL